MSYTEMAQLELMNAAANVTSQEDLDALRLTLSLFFAERAQQAIDKMWDEGTFDQKKLDELRGQHLRTPYKTFQADDMRHVVLDTNALIQALPTRWCSSRNTG